jgi:hypothetical protein
VDELDCGLNPLKVRKLLITAGEVARCGKREKIGDIRSLVSMMQPRFSFISNL